MAGISSMGGVGAGLRHVQFQTAYQARALKEQLNTSETLGNAALKLIKTALSPGTSLGHDLDVTA